MIECCCGGGQDVYVVDSTPRAMLQQILLALNRRWPRTSSPPTVAPWNHEDFSWHSSSFELARGLEVIECRDATGAVFFDTLPAFKRAEA